MSIPGLCVKNLQIHSEIAKVNQVMIITLLPDQQWQLQQLQSLQSELQNHAEEITVRGRSQTTFTKFGFFLPPTPLRLHFL